MPLRSSLIVCRSQGSLAQYRQARPCSGSVAARASPKGSLVVMIEDNGGGISQHRRASGHGLANMRNRLQHVGGIFEQASEVGRGTKVRLVLPLKDA